ncbi:T cell receptor alpha variable 38-2/delta variable 8 [Amia ocellicauda]|uniref:T cell receptor alpha variable 38-2/delta variable 8 n=1 Tax=Amia ocellicauda TaxID=2972642 RepID=UPI0034642442
MGCLGFLWALCLWTTVIGLFNQNPDTIYVELKKTGSLSCSTPDKNPSGVYWYFWSRGTNELKFLFYCTVTGRFTYDDSLTEMDRFKSSKRDSMGTIFTLKITNVKAKDAGIYFCAFSNGTHLEMKKGIDLRPGERRPTQPPPTIPPEKPKPCRCINRPSTRPKQGKTCEAQVLWSLVGGVLGLTVVLICTLYYFSRLPKKCRHRLIKKQQLR